MTSSESNATAPEAPEVIRVPSKELLTIGRVLAGRYEIQGRLGAGGMGAVYRAHDRELDEDVALKMVLPERLDEPKTLARFRAEVKIARKITHPNVCRVFDLAEDEGLLFLTMELVEGSTLRELVAAGPIDPARALDLFQQVTDGVAAAHEKGIVHRDLKPENVLLRRDDRCVVADFGLARGPGLGASTAAGGAGTPAYMSPEQIRAEPLDVRSDVFTLGIIGFELLTGKSPFAADSPGVVTTAILRAGPPPLVLPGLPEGTRKAIEAVLVKALERRPEDRFASAGELAAALAKARRGGAETRSTLRGVSDGAPAAPPSIGKTNLFVGRRGVIAAATAVVVVVVVAFVLRRSSFERSATAPPAPSGSAAIPQEDRAAIVVLPFENLTGDPAWEGLAKSAPEALRGVMRAMKEMRLVETAAVDVVAARNAGATFWMRGSVQRVGARIRLAAQIEPIDAETGAAPGEPIEIDEVEADPRAALAELRQRALDEARLAVRAFERRRRALRGTNVAVAREKFLAYEAMIGPAPKPEHFDRGLTLLDEALAADPAYVPAIVARAHLAWQGAGPGTDATRMARALEELGRALSLAPTDGLAHETRCRIARGATELAERRTDQAFEQALEACTLALRVFPTSAEARIALARLEDRRCRDEEAMRFLEESLELDRAVSGRALRYLVTLALQGDRLPIADHASARLVAFQEEEQRLGPRALGRRAGMPPVRGAHLFRGVTLLRLGKTDEAAEAFRKERVDASASKSDAWAEAAAIRGLVRIASQRREAPAEDLVRRLDRIEANFKAKPGGARRLASAYSFVDPAAALAWIEPPSETDGCEAAFDKTLAYQAAGKLDRARQSLAMCKPAFAWERSCVEALAPELGP
ncbi:serine/threonine-protein kinase [Polyangium jinanense]|uniref:Protein kinase n=1 Tax=Polyangium jinanense TaxID=2829994 RepID=A0A9X3X8J5_9BACT|nr:serine/threonine-protein kinase [Polyangium jinanense]MDC3959999.1 protein kinase [Polyangium jinanense]MDC3986217.1 protein kinase [Polyangium jinanense]